MAFLRIKCITSSDGSKTCYTYLVKNYWDKQKKQSRQKVIKYLGKTYGLNKIITKNIFQRDGYKCKNCNGKFELTIDHIIPLTKGGTNDESNLQILCIVCNSRKGIMETLPIPLTDYQAKLV